MEAVTAADRTAGDAGIRVEPPERGDCQPLVESGGTRPL